MRLSFSMLLAVFSSLLILIFEIGSLSSFANSLAKHPRALASVTQSTTDPIGDFIEMFEKTSNGKVYVVGRTVIETTPNCVYNTLTDYEHAPRIFSSLKSCRVVSQTPDSKNIFFSASAAGGLLTLAYVLEVKEKPPNLIEWRRVNGSFKANQGYWKLEPVRSGKATLVTYSKYVDGGLFIPKFFIRRELHANMQLVLSELRKHSEMYNKRIAHAEIPPKE